LYFTRTTANHDSNYLLNVLKVGTKSKGYVSKEE
jgi:hypothetical protein